MRVFIPLFLIVATANANWFSKNTGSSPAKEWSDWDQDKLNDWLNEHRIGVPKGSSKEELQTLVGENWYAGQEWTQKQFGDLAARYKNVKQSSIDSWTESETRDWLQKHGVVPPPSSPLDKLKQLAYRQYRAYQSASSSLADKVSTSIYGAKGYQAEKTISSLSQTATSLPSSASQAIQSIISDASDYTQERLDDTKDYVFSTWDNNQLRLYLEEKGVIEPTSELTRNELLAKVKGAYLSVSDPIWSAWSDSCLFNWLHSRGLVSTDEEKKRDQLVKAAEKYYYNAKDNVYDSWTESQLREWLIDHNVIKSDAQIRREKLERLIRDNYVTALDTVWGGWTDSELRSWLIEHGYLRSDAQVKRDELVKLMNDKYTDVATTVAAYLTWPDARLRAYLRTHGVDDAYVPTSRPSLLHEVRIRWVRTSNRVEEILQKIRDAISHSAESVEERLADVLSLLTGTAHDAREYTKTKVAEGYEYASEKGEEGYEYVQGKGHEGQEYLTQKQKEKASSLSGAAGKTSRGAKQEL
ncbi:uncharacterized protein EI90DRAFT_3120102 [Cantharellus anzutake]|uniref:uncharacterized protein n=1 Tax=Cantharellus anzutake TaxID=1750568 RepID=UPI0019050E4A|nr:uncharacterized protein EI90DRAFT_3120102 [Cantharellus anzutake]KAF8335847.1 hypothetical protein EI90DRAFT_3120102 [Cantharellus anzutake]